jgi:CRP-like cAMP-binding protein
VRRGGKELTRLEVGDYFGELSLFDPAPRNASVTAIGTLSCVVLRRSDFARVLDGVPELRDALLRGMARRIHQLDQRA